MAIKYQSHQVANSPEFVAGIPAAWPRVEEQVPDDWQLSPVEIDAGMALIAEDAWRKLREENLAAFEQWRRDRMTADSSAKTTAVAQGETLVGALKLIAGSAGNLSAAQLSDAVRVCARALILLEQVVRNSEP